MFVYPEGDENDAVTKQVRAIFDKIKASDRHKTYLVFGDNKVEQHVFLKVL